MPAPEPSSQQETFKKKDVIEILSHKKAYNACKYKMPYYFIMYFHVSLFKLFYFKSFTCDSSFYFFLISPDLGAYLGFRIWNLWSVFIFLLTFSHPDSPFEAVSWGAASGADEHGHW